MVEGSKEVRFFTFHFFFHYHLDPNSIFSCFSVKKYYLNMIKGSMEAESYVLYEKIRKFKFLNILRLKSTFCFFFQATTHKTSTKQVQNKTTHKTSARQIRPFLPIFCLFSTILKRCTKETQTKQLFLRSFKRESSNSNKN